MRATNSYYRKQIQMSNFNFYFTRATTIPAIVDHVLSNYGDIPLGVHFKKSIEQELFQYADHIWKLSNLTALSFDFLPKFLDNDNNIWKLALLTKLTVFPNYPKGCGKYYNLRCANLDKFSNDELERMYNIEEFLYFTSYLQRTKAPYDFIPNPDRLTRMLIYQDKIDFNTLTRFTNLKTLEFRDKECNPDNQIALSKLTTVRDLVVGGLNYYGCYNMTNLTSLYIEQAMPEVSRISALYNLKELVFGSYRGGVDQVELDLAPLTALHSLNCARHYTALDVIYATIQSPRLTELQLSVHQGFHIAHLTSLHHSLKALTIQENNVYRCHVDYSALSHLTNLVSLQIKLCTSRPSLTIISNLTNLTKLEVTRLDAKIGLLADWSLSKLTNLEVLNIGTAPNGILNDLCHATKLTELEIRLTPEQIAQNNTCLESLINLKYLFLQGGMNDNHFWQAVTKLTALEGLQLFKVDSDEQIGSLSTLTRLTLLEVFESKTLSGRHLRRLTSLQVLHFPSRLARARGMKKKNLRKFAANMPHLYSYYF
jgi:hypothetical protein